jgi:hypothetical protein
LPNFRYHKIKGAKKKEKKKKKPMVDGDLGKFQDGHVDF